MSQITTARSKRFRFDSQYDLLLARTLLMLGAHVSPYGAVERKFEGVLAAFCSHQAIIEKIESGTPAPKLTILGERYMKLVSNLRGANKKS